MKFIKNMSIEKVEKFINSRILKDLIKELLKISLILPLAFLIAPTFGVTTEMGIVTMIIIVAIVLYAVSVVLRKKFFDGNEIKQILFISALTVICVVLDCLTGTNLMKNSIFSYDAIVGARYYGMGNEYQGLVIGASLFTVAAICSFKKLPKLVIALYCLCIMFTTASPLMGANVGASISEFVAFVALLMLLSDTKINLKKVCLVGIGAVVVVAVFAVIDKVSGSSSHLSLFVGQIFEDGPVAIIQTFSRKISMNLKIFKTSSWAYVIIVSIISILMLNASDKGRLRSVKAENKVLYKGFIANLIGCVITLLVNDSGVLSAAIASMYVMMPLLVLSLNKDAKENIK
jgi:hypothetical protein